MPPPSHAIFRTIVRSLRWTMTRAGFALASHLAPQAATRHAARLFCTPAPGTRLRARSAALPVGAGLERLALPDGRMVQTYAWGDPRREPYVLLAHGWSSHGSRFTAWIGALREAGYAVVAFDQPAHGLSEGQQASLPEFVDTVLAVGAHFGPAAGVVGHSLGGTASALAVARGLQARRVVLVAPAADPMDAARRFARMIGLAQHLCARMSALFRDALGLGFEDLQVHRNTGRIGRPALIVHDVLDREVPWSEGERIARHWPGARLLSTTGLGHHRIVDDAGVIEAALRFLRGGSPGERVVSTPNLPYGLA